MIINQYDLYFDANSRFVNSKKLLFLPNNTNIIIDQQNRIQINLSNLFGLE